MMGAADLRKDKKRLFADAPNLALQRALLEEPLENLDRRLHALAVASLGSNRRARRGTAAERVPTEENERFARLVSRTVGSVAEAVYDAARGEERGQALAEGVHVEDVGT